MFPVNRHSDEVIIQQGEYEYLKILASLIKFLSGDDGDNFYIIDQGEVDVCFIC